MSVFASASLSEIVSTVFKIYTRALLLEGLNLGDESLHLRLHHSVGLIGRCKFGCMLGGGGCAFVFVNFEAHHHLIYDGVGVVEANFINRSASLSELKVSFLEVVLENFPILVRQSGAFPRTDVVLKISLFVEDNESEVHFLTLG